MECPPLLGCSFSPLRLLNGAGVGHCPEKQGGKTRWGEALRSAMEKKCRYIFLRRISSIWKILRIAGKVLVFKTSWNFQKSRNSG